MQLEDLDMIQQTWDNLTGLAQDAYREVRDNIRVDEYSETTWNQVLWYLDTIQEYLAPSDINLRSETEEVKQKIKLILQGSFVTFHPTQQDKEFWLSLGCPFARI